MAGPIIITADQAPILVTLQVHGKAVTLDLTEIEVIDNQVAFKGVDIKKKVPIIVLPPQRQTKYITNQ